MMNILVEKAAAAVREAEAEQYRAEASFTAARKTGDRKMTEDAFRRSEAVTAAVRNLTKALLLLKNLETDAEDDTDSERPETGGWITRRMPDISDGPEEYRYGERCTRVIAHVISDSGQKIDTVREILFYEKTDFSTYVYKFDKWQRLPEA